MKKLLSIKNITLLIICLTFLLAGAFSFTRSAYADGSTETYEVKFVLDENGTEYETQSVSHGGYASIPDTPYLAGKIFEYWVDENGEVFSFETSIEKNTTLTAIWWVKVTLHTVKFCVNGEVINEQVVKSGAGQKVIAPTGFDCGEGMEFDYWDKSFDSVSEDLVVNAVLKTKEYTINVYGFNKEFLTSINVLHGENAILPTAPTIENYECVGHSGKIENIVEDGAVYLNYEPIEYTVTFTVDGEPFESKQSELVKYGNTVNFPGVVSRLGHVFMGWFVDLESDEMFDFSTPITKDLELKAKVVPVIEKYEVKFYDFDKNQYGGTQLVESGKSAIRPGNPYKEGYEFEGWSEDYQNITADTNIYPIFKIKTYTVKFYSEDTLLSEQKINYGDSAIEPTDIPEKQGFEFIRWDKNFNKVSEDLDVMAVFEEKTFVVMFYNHQMDKVVSTQYVKYGKSAIEPNLAGIEGYDFLGWDGDYTFITKDVVFVAQYQAKVYTIEFYYNGQVVNSQEVAYGNNVDFYIYELEGHLFYGWYLDENFTNPFSFNTKLTENIKVYAKMQEKPAETFTVIFKGKDGSVISSQVVEKGESAILPAGPNIEGFDFTGWTKENGDGEYTEVLGDLEYKASYNIKYYKVVFRYGSEIYSEQQVAYGGGAEEPTSISLKGHEFSGWDKDFDVVKGDLTINAIFTANEYEVYFKYEIDGATYLTQIVKFGEKVSIPKAPKKDGYTFKKWQVIEDGVLVDFSFDTAIEGETILVAIFEGTPYTVYYYVNGEMYHSQKVLFGEAIPEIDDPDYGSKYVFAGWSDIPDTMPAKNLTITGKMLKYYTVYFVIDGEIYQTEEVLEGAKIPEVDDPDFGSDFVFVGWSEIPSVMPKEDVTITGTMLKYYKVFFVIDGEIYQTSKVLEGEKIELPEPPEFDTIKYSFEWENVPNVMPKKDITIGGTFTLLSTDKDNEIVLEVQSENKKTIINLYVRGKVNIGGMLLEIRVKNLEGVTATIDEKFADYNVKDNAITFVWAQGENLTEYKALATFVIESDQIELTANNVSISTYAFNQDAVVVADSSLIIINK